jgi:terminase large subunit-like protein
MRVPRLHHGQRDLARIADRSKVTVGVLGRRWGKTYFGISYAFDRMTRAIKPVTDAAWIAPTYDHTRIARDELFRWYRPAIRDWNQSEHWVRFHNMHKLWFRSADNPTSIRGRGYGLVLVDEGAYIGTSTFENEILPTLMDSDGDLVLFTTPAGRRGFVFDEYQRAVHGDAGYGFLTRPSTDNPNPKIKSWLEHRRKKMSHTAYRQEILAEFIEDALSLFRNASAVVGGALAPPLGGHRYYAGVDLAKSHDWTVVIVLDLSTSPWSVVSFDRFHEMSWASQASRVASICKRYNNAKACVDATSVGDPVIEMIEKAGTRVDGFVFTGNSRTELLDQLSVHYDNRTIRIPQELDDGILGEEIRSFHSEIDDGKKVRYVASGEFDDCVMALALATYGAPEYPAGRAGHGIEGRPYSGPDGEDDEAVGPEIMRREF